MSKCSACEDLRNDAPNFVLNGVTEEVCTSLKNNTGFNPNLSPLNDNCTDLDNANECLVGNMADQIEAYDVCEWKDYMEKFVPNVYTVLDAMICSDCGTWENINAISDKLQELCTLTEASLQPPVKGYGILNLAETSERRCGTIPKKNGSAIVKPLPDDGTLNPYTKHSQNFGVYYAKKQVTSCTDGKCREYEWISVNTYLYYLTANVEVNDVLWYCDKSTFQSTTGFSDYLWRVFTESSYTWKMHPCYGGNMGHMYAWFQLTVAPGNMSENYIGIVYKGTGYPNTEPNTDVQIDNQNNSPVMYVHVCGAK